MLTLESLRIVNLFQYEDAEVHFTPGINLITGPNGSGKTNIINCIFYALSGNLPTVKEKCYRIGSSAKDALVELTLVSNRDRYKITRFLDTPGKTSIIKGKSLIAIGAEKVNSAILELLGSDNKIDISNVYVTQDKLRFIIDSPPRERKQWLLNILGLSKIKSLCENLGVFINTWKKVISEVNLDSIEKEIEELTNKLNSIPSIDKTAEQITKEMQEVINKISEAKVIEQLLSMLQELTDKEGEVINKKEDFKKKLILTEEQISNHLQATATIKKLRQDALSVFRRRQKILKKTEQVSIKELENKNLFLRVKLQTILSNLSTCPVCETPTHETDLTKATVESVEQEIAENNELIIKIKKEILAATKDTGILREEVKSKIKFIREEINKNKSLLLKDVSEEIVSQQSKIIDEIKKLENELDRISASITDITDKTKGKKYIRREKEEEKLKLLEQEREILFERKSVTELLNSKIKERDKLKEFKDKEKKLEIIKEVRRIFSSEQFIANATTSFTKKLESRINRYLSVLQANYRIEFSPLMEVLTKFHDGKILTEKSLSFGEQLMLCLSFNFSILADTNSGFILLDEPTLGLDEYRVSLLPEFFREVSKVMADEYQFICTSHEERLVSGADSVIDVLSLQA